MPRSVLPDVPASGRRRRRGTSMALAVALTVSGLGVALTGTSAQAAALPYQDPTLPVGDAGRRPARPDDPGREDRPDDPGRARASSPPRTSRTYRLGSVLSGGGSAPSPNNAAGWADMYDGFQRAALATPLQIPMIYGVDAVHGHNNVARRDDLPAQHRPRRDPRPGAGAATSAGPSPRRSPAPASTGLRAVPVRGPQRPLGPHLRVVRREARSSPTSMATIITGPAGRARWAGPASVLATAKHYVGDGGTTGGDRPGQHPAQRGRAARDPPAAVPGRGRSAASAR